MATIQTIAVCEIVAVIASSAACQKVPRIATMKAAIIVFEWPGSSPCSAPSRIALGMNSHAALALCCTRSAKGVMSTSEEGEGVRRPWMYTLPGYSIKGVGGRTGRADSVRVGKVSPITLGCSQR